MGFRTVLFNILLFRLGFILFVYFFLGEKERDILGNASQT